MTITALLPEHWTAVKTIYEDGLATGNASFQTAAPSWKEWNESHLAHSRFVAIDEGKVIGWAALTPVSGRCVYAGVAEVSVYIDPVRQGEGVGRALVEALIIDSEKNGIWTLQAGIFPENIASVKLHEKCGFWQVGIRKKIGKMHGVWRDTVLLEKRSETVGTN